MSARKRLHHSSDDFRANAYALLYVLQSQKPLQDEVIREPNHLLRVPFFVHKSESELEYAYLFRAQCGGPFPHYKGIDHRYPRKTHWLQPRVLPIIAYTPHDVGIGSRSAFLHINDDLRVDRRSNTNETFYEPREPPEPGVWDLVRVSNWAKFIVYLRRVRAEVHPHL
jgi:hypothetical protein